jgi:HNH endonuclease/AP2 domain
MKADELGVIFDESDRALVEQHSWRINSWGYPYTHVRRNGERKRVEMHRLFITEVPLGHVVDHINRNPCDNRRSNLRVCTHGQNRMNSKEVANRASKYRGVTWNRNCGKWQAQVRRDGRMKYLGVFSCEEAAAAAVAPFFTSPFHPPMNHPGLQRGAE